MIDTNMIEEGDKRFTLLHQGQMNCLRLDEVQYKPIYCSDQPGRWCVPLTDIEPPLAYGHVQLTPAGRLKQQLKQGDK